LSAFQTIAGIEVLELPTNWPVGPVNLFLVRGEKLTLVDCGRKLPVAWRMFVDFLKTHDLTPRDIEQIVLTHHHDDHVGLLDYLLAERDIPIYAHANSLPYLTNDQAHYKRSEAFFYSLYKQFGIEDNVSHKLSKRTVPRLNIQHKIMLAKELDEGVAIPGLPDWQVLETKGHAQSHISLYRPNDRILLCGDHLIKHVPAGIFQESPITPATERSKPLLQYIDNLHKLAKLPVSVALSGHGEPIDHVHEHIWQVLRKIEKRIRKVADTLKEGPKTGLEIVQDLYKHRYQSQLELFTSDTLGLLDLLIHQAKITAETRDGVIYYKL